jgi:hypothetical protein
MINPSLGTTGNIVEISRLHSSLSSCISNFELENMREQERYLYELLLESK